MKDTKCWQATYTECGELVEVLVIKANTMKAAQAQVKPVKGEEILSVAPLNRAFIRSLTGSAYRDLMKRVEEEGIALYAP